MTRIEIMEKLRDILAMAMGDAAAEMLANCTEDSSLTADLALNSVGMLYVVIAIEEFFGIQFDDVGFGDFSTVRDVVDYIEKKVK